jgi:serine/threonine protein kinase
MTDRIGQRFGNYRLISMLGKGGFAAVYLGQHTYLDTQAAIKVLHMYLAGEAIEKFLTEAKTITKLRHPHIVGLLDFGVEDNIPYMVMDYAPGGTLRNRHQIGTQVPLTTIVPYIKQIAEALQFAHEKKLIHRDLKPENLLVGKNDEILLGDFGIAVIAHSSLSQKTEELAGTVSYLAPEQINGHPKQASDQYALGVIVYEWLSGTPPFSGTHSEIISQHLHAPPPPLHSWVPTISFDVEQVVLRALSKDPQQRFPSVQDFALAFEQACQSKHTINFALPPNSPSPPRSLPPTVPVIPPPMGTLLRTYPGHIGRITGILWSINGQYIATRGNDQKVQVWDSMTGNSMFIYQSHPRQGRSSSLNWLRRPTMTPAVTSITWSPDSTQIAIGSSDGTVQIWEAATGMNLLTYPGHAHPIQTLTWSPSGKFLVSKDSWFTHVWDTNSGIKGFEFPGLALLSPDGTRIASTDSGYTVHVWNMFTRSKIFTFRGHTEGVKFLAWSPNGIGIASASNSLLLVSNTTVGANISSGHGLGEVDGIVWSPKGEHIAVAAPQYLYAVLLISNITFSNCPWIPFSGRAYNMLWSPDGQRITFWNTSGYVQIWNISPGSGSVSFLEQLGGARYVNSANRAGQIIFTYTGPNHIVVLSPDGTRIATASDDKTLQLWSAINGSHIFSYLGHPGRVTALAWSPDGSRIASGGDDGMVRVWQAI